MKALAQVLIGLMVSVAAYADDTPVFVSCYADDGTHLQLIFDTAQTQFSYRNAQHSGVEEWDAIPAGPFMSVSRVTKSIPADQNHIELSAHIVNGDIETPIIDTDVQVVFDRDETGSLRLTSYSLFHLSQPYNLDNFKTGSCYVQ